MTEEEMFNIFLEENPEEKREDITKYKSIKSVDVREICDSKPLILKRYALFIRYKDGRKSKIYQSDKYDEIIIKGE